MPLLNTQKKALFEAIQASPLKVDQFEMIDEPGDKSTYIFLRDTQFSFNFEWGYRGEGYGQEVGYVCDYTPGSRFVNETYLATNFGNLCRIVNEWATNCHTELNTPDPWAQFGKRATFATDQNNTLLDDADQKVVLASIAEVKSLLLKNTEHQDEVVTRLNSLEVNIDKIGRKDLYLIAIGIIADIAVNDFVSSETARSAWKILVEGFTRILDFLPSVQSTLLGQ